MYCTWKKQAWMNEEFLNKLASGIYLLNYRNPVSQIVYLYLCRKIDFQ